jgi:hypothetical protein
VVFKNTFRLMVNNMLINKDIFECGKEWLPSQARPVQWIGAREPTPEALTKYKIRVIVKYRSM